MIIGITGKSCAGKDFLCAILKERGYRELNLDSIGHRALEHKREAVLDALPEFGNAQKNIDRKKLGNFVFRRPAALYKLETILHPYMKELVLQELEQPKGTGRLGEPMMECSSRLILNAAILEKLGLLPLCDLVLWVEAPLWLRAWRRKKLTLLQFLYRNWAQRSLRPPSGLAKVHRIHNNRMHKKTGLSNILEQLEQIPQLEESL